MSPLLRTPPLAKIFLAAVALSGACAQKAPSDRVRVSGQVAGRILELRVAEGDRVARGDLVARLDTADAELAVARAQAERDHADAQLRLL